MQKARCIFGPAHPPSARTDEWDGLEKVFLLPHETLDDSSQTDDLDSSSQPVCTKSVPGQLTPIEFGEHNKVFPRKLCSSSAKKTPLRRGTRTKKNQHLGYGCIQSPLKTFEFVMTWHRKSSILAKAGWQATAAYGVTWHSDNLLETATPRSSRNAKTASSSSPPDSPTIRLSPHMTYLLFVA